MKLTRYPGNPVLAPIEAHEWESRTVFNCGVAYDNGAVILIYRAQGIGANVSRLGFAVSADGVHFSRLDRQIDAQPFDTRHGPDLRPLVLPIDDEQRQDEVRRAECGFAHQVAHEGAGAQAPLPASPQHVEVIFRPIAHAGCLAVPPDGGKHRLVASDDAG